VTPERDEPSGQQTTGHEWDGIKELNTPVPKAMSIWLWISIAVAVAMWLLYPTWPFVTNYTKGLLGYSSRVEVDKQTAKGAELRAGTMAAFANEDIQALADDPTLRAKHQDAIGVLFRDNCAACHGRDLQGQPEFPKLTDAHWLWSSLPEEIEYTIQNGINSADNDDTRYAEMAAYGRDELLEKREINNVVDYVLSLSAQNHDSEAAANGALVFEDNCASCHADGGIGGLENGAPSLTDDVWIYGGSRENIRETLQNGRAGVMPAWSARLSAEEIRMLTLYVLWAGEDDRQN
jgi:cytochrome c oxidase cbb3-type subunit 3